MHHPTAISLFDRARKQSVSTRFYTARMPCRKRLARRAAAGYVLPTIMNPLSVIEAHLAELLELGARRIGVFGSFARGEAGKESDVDVYVEFEESRRTYDNFFALHELLERLLGRRVDLVTDKSLTE